MSIAFSSIFFISFHYSTIDDALSDNDDFEAELKAAQEQAEAKKQQIQNNGFDDLDNQAENFEENIHNANLNNIGIGDMGDGVLNAGLVNMPNKKKKKKKRKPKLDAAIADPLGQADFLNIDNYPAQNEYPEIPNDGSLPPIHNYQGKLIPIISNLSQINITKN